MKKNRSRDEPISSDETDEATRELIRSITSTDQAAKLAEFKKQSERILRSAEDAAEIWWKNAKDAPDPVGALPDQGELQEQREEFENVGMSVEYLHQLYMDAAKAQKRLQQIGAMAEESHELIARMPSVKGIARATEKARMGDGGEASFLRDLARGTIEVRRLDRMKDAVAAFLEKAREAAPGAAITRYKNKFASPAPSGYGDIQLHIQLDGGHICEMQFQCTTLLDFKEMGGYPGRAGYGEEKPDWANWAVLLGDEGPLLEAKETIPLLESMTDVLGEIPDDAARSMAKFKAGDWQLTSHDTYNIWRWLDAKKETAPSLTAEIERIANVWSGLEAAATLAVKKMVNVELGGSPHDTNAYDEVVRRIAEIDVRVGVIE
jgi:hypothetical protein